MYCSYEQEKLTDLSRRSLKINIFGIFSKCKLSMSRLIKLYLKTSQFGLLGYQFIRVIKAKSYIFIIWYFMKTLKILVWWKKNIRIVLFRKEVYSTKYKTIKLVFYFKHMYNCVKNIYMIYIQNTSLSFIVLIIMILGCVLFQQYDKIDSFLKFYFHYSNFIYF